MDPRVLVFKVSRAVRLHGWRGTAGWAAEALRSRVLFAETHVWYELDPRAQRPRRELERGLILRRGGEQDAPLLAGLDTVAPAEAQRRLQAGDEHWIVLDGETLLFSCWIFRRRAPVMAAPAGQLELEPDMACLEDSVTTAPARGRGIAPAAWTEIADRLAEDDVGRMITKVTVENTPSRRAVEKAGFVGVALMRYERAGPLRRTSVKPLDPDRAQFFIDRIDPAAGRPNGSLPSSVPVG